jgi:beta-glucuronidase
LPGQIDKAVVELARELDALHASTGKPVIITEFGADAIAGSHSEPPQMWTEEYQAAIIKAYLDLAATRPWIAGTHIWNFADFKTGQATHRAMSMNFKGVFTRDRQPKMAARFLRERWTGKR